MSELGHCVVFWFAGLLGGVPHTSSGSRCLMEFA
jgi:hypothetical protein